MKETDMTNSGNKLPVTAIVVGLNEESNLESCLSKLTFCQEICYYDLGSDDRSVEVAEFQGAKVFAHELVPFAEHVLAKHADSHQFDWILITDPDEEINEELSLQIYEVFTSVENLPKVGCIKVPIVYYFSNRKISGTPWGGTNSRVLIVHRDRFKFEAIVHGGRNLLEGFESVEIPSDGGAFIKHKWVNSWVELWNKHQRYLLSEGKDRYQNGQRSNLFEIILSPTRQFLVSFLKKKGYLDGILGFQLSLFWAYYQTAALVKLYKYQNSHKRGSISK